MGEFVVYKLRNANYTYHYGNNMATQIIYNKYMLYIMYTVSLDKPAKNSWLWMAGLSRRPVYQDSRDKRYLIKQFYY